MSNDKQQQLAKSSWGRIKLHLLCYLRDNKFRFHYAGIKREITA